MVTVQSVQSHTELTHPFKFFDLRAPWRSELSGRMPECQKIKKGGLHQYGAERFDRLIVCHNQKKCRTKRVKRLEETYLCRLIERCRCL